MIQQKSPKDSNSISAAAQEPSGGSSNNNQRKHNKNSSNSPNTIPGFGANSRVFRRIHDRLGHFSRSTIQRTLPHVDGIDITSDMVAKADCRCETCQMAKLSRLPFSKTPRKRATTPCTRIWSDVCGPCGTLSRTGKRYFVSDDDKIGKTWYPPVAARPSEGPGLPNYVRLAPGGLVMECVLSIEHFLQHEV